MYIMTRSASDTTECLGLLMVYDLDESATSMWVNDKFLYNHGSNNF